MKKLIIYLFFSILAIGSFAQGAFDYVATAAGTNTYTATILVPTFPSSYTGVEMRITFTNGNTGASTINITRSTGAVGAVAIRKWDGDSFEPLISGDIPAGEQVTLRYTGSYFIMDSFGKGSSGGTLTDGSGTTANGTAVDLGGAVTANPTFTGNFNWTWGSSGSRIGNYRVWSNGTIGLDGSTIAFLQTGSNTISTSTSGIEIATTGAVYLNTDPGTAGQQFITNGSGSAPTWQNPKFSSLDKTASFVAAIAEAGIYHYNISPASATTITFPSLAGQEGLQWAFWKNVDADLVQFDFGAETYNGATVLPDTSWVYVNWSDGRFKVAGTNPSSGGGGGSGTVTNVTGTSPISVATGTTTPVVSIANAAADGSTLGAASFTAADFNAAGGNISIDYTNGQAASGSNKGFLTSADFTTLSAKQAAIAFGTGVQTALGVNIGSAGAPVLFNAAGGTPSSMTLTNATGLPVAGSGTGVASLTAYAPIFGGTTSTGAVQSGTVGSSGQILTSNGAGALPTFQNAAAGFANPMTTAGDLIYGASGGTATRLAGASGVLHSTGAATPTWAAVNLASEVTGDLPLSNVVQIGSNTVLGNVSTSTADAAALSEASLRDIVFNTKKYDRIYSTFLGGTSEFLSFTSGTAAIVTYSGVGGDTNHNGMVRMSAGTTTTGLAFLRTGNLSSIVPANGEISYDAVVKTDATLSDGTDTYILYSGLSNDNAAEPAHGLYFRYSHSVNGGEWQFISRNSSAETAVDTNVLVATSTFYRTTIVLNAAGTSAEGFINGTSIGTITTNLPSGVVFGITTGIRKTAGTNNRNFDCDFIDTIIELTTSK